jgi:large subunit ribosomal protein L23
MAKHVLQLHLTTEKSALMKEDPKQNKYVFRVDKDANKNEITAAVEKAFNVKVDSVRTMIVPGKAKRTRYKVGRTPSWKKAIVKLPAGQVIADFENI